MTKLDHHSTLRCVSAVLFLLLTATFSPAQQETVETKEPGEQDQQEQKADAPMAFLPSWAKERVAKIQQRGGPPQGFAPTFGDIKRGSGFAPGVAYAHSLSSGGVVVLKGAYSINNYKMVQMAAQSAPVAGRRLIFRSRARWQDAPSVRLYALGSDSPAVRTGYAETKTEVSGETAWTPASFVRVLAGVGLEQFDTGFVQPDCCCSPACLARRPIPGTCTARCQPRSTCATARATAVVAACCRQPFTTFTRRPVARSHSSGLTRLRSNTFRSCRTSGSCTSTSMSRRR